MLGKGKVPVAETGRGERGIYAVIAGAEQGPRRNPDDRAVRTDIVRNKSCIHVNLLVSKC